MQVHDNPARHRFEIALDDGETAFAAYQLDEGTITFTHTIVPPGHEGEGVGSTLVKAGLAAARERGLKVVALCPFFAAHFRKHAENRDLLADGELERLEIEG